MKPNSKKAMYERYCKPQSHITEAAGVLIDDAGKLLHRLIITVIVLVTALVAAVGTCIYLYLGG